VYRVTIQLALKRAHYFGLIARSRRITAAAPKRLIRSYYTIYKSYRLIAITLSFEPGRLSHP